MYDIVIVGAGPAGSNLARLIGDKYKVLLIDKRDLDNQNPMNNLSKCCGGLLAPDAQKMIAKLGLSMPKEILVDPQIFAVRTIDLTNNLERLYQRFYLNMDREKFDKWLVSLISDNVDKRFNVLFKGFNKVSDGYEIRYLFNGKEIIEKTRVIVGADGAFSKVRNSLINNSNALDRYISIQEWYKCEHHIPYYIAIFDEEISDFYSWIIPKENYLIFGSALSPKDNTLEKYNKLKSKIIKFGFNLDNKVKTEGAYINRPKKSSQFFIGNYKVALVGEASGAISPSSAEGISYALKSSLYLTQSLEEGLDGFLDRYSKRVYSIKGNLLLKNLKSPAMYNPFFRKLAMKSGLQSIK